MERSKFTQPARVKAAAMGTLPRSVVALEPEPLGHQLRAGGGHDGHRVLDGAP